MAANTRSQRAKMTVEEFYKPHYALLHQRKSPPKNTPRERIVETGFHGTQTKASSFAFLFMVLIGSSILYSTTGQAMYMPVSDTATHQQDDAVLSVSDTATHQQDYVVLTVFYTVTNQQDDAVSPVFYTDTNQQDDAVSPVFYTDTNQQDDAVLPVFYTDTNQKQDQSIFEDPFDNTSETLQDTRYDDLTKSVQEDEADEARQKWRETAIGATGGFLTGAGVTSYWFLTSLIPSVKARDVVRGKYYAKVAVKGVTTTVAQILKEVNVVHKTLTVLSSQNTFQVHEMNALQNQVQHLQSTTDFLTKCKEKMILDLEKTTGQVEDLQSENRLLHSKVKWYEDRIQRLLDEAEETDVGLQIEIRKSDRLQNEVLSLESEKIRNKADIDRLFNRIAALHQSVFESDAKYTELMNRS